MKRWINVVAQVVLGAGQVVNILEPVLEAREKIFIAAGLALAQLVVSAIAHGYNPDGSPAK